MRRQKFLLLASAFILNVLVLLFIYWCSLRISANEDVQALFFVDVIASIGALSSVITSILLARKISIDKFAFSLFGVASLLDFSAAF